MGSIIDSTLLTHLFGGSAQRGDQRTCPPLEECFSHLLQLWGGFPAARVVAEVAALRYAHSDLVGAAGGGDVVPEGGSGGMGHKAHGKAREKLEGCQLAPKL